MNEPRFHFDQYTVRPITEADRAYIEQLIAADAYHRDRMTAEFFLPFPDQNEARTDLRRLFDRDVHCLFLYTGGVANLFFNHRRQFREMFGDFDNAGPRLQVEYLAQADHLFSAHGHRQNMFERVETWIRRFLLNNSQ